MVHCSIALILFWICRQAIIGKEVGGPCCTLAKYNADQADLGGSFFYHLIHNNDSFKHVNEQNVCSLIHFFIREAAHNGQPIRFSSG
jgi:hypothetical protein